MRMCSTLRMCLSALAVTAALSSAPARAQEDATLDGLRADATAVITAIAARIAGDTRTAAGTLAFAPDIGDVADPSGLTYAGRQLSTVALTSFEAPEDIDGIQRLTAILRHDDFLGRRSYVTIGADYMMGDGNLLITRAAVAPFYPAEGSTQLLLVDTDRLPDHAFLERATMGDVLLLCLAASVEPGEAADLAASGRLGIFAADMARMHPEAFLTLTAPPALAQAVSHEVHGNTGGWPYLLAAFGAIPDGLNGAEIGVVRAGGPGNAATAVEYSF